MVNGFSGFAWRRKNSMVKCSIMAIVNRMIPGMKSIDVVCSGMNNESSAPMMMAVIDRKLKVFSNFIGAEVLRVFFAPVCLTINDVRTGSIRSHIMKM